MPLAEAVRSFESKGLKLGFDWPDVWQEEHARAFTVAKVTRRDILVAPRQPAHSPQPWVAVITSLTLLASWLRLKGLGRKLNSCPTLERKASSA